MAIPVISMSDKIENFSDDNFSGQDLSGQNLAGRDKGPGASLDQNNPGSPAKSISGTPEGSDSSQKEYLGQCPYGVCSLSWKPLRPAA